MAHRIHVAAAAIALLTILMFWTSSAAVELIGDPALIVWVKTAIPWGLIVLIPALAATGGTGRALAKGRDAPLLAGKARRMPVIAGIGLLVLVPAVLFLARKAHAGELDVMFHAVQAVELFAGGVNLTLMFLNARDGLRAARRCAPAATAAG